MPAGKLDLLIEQGATFRHTLIVRQGSEATSPAANLTGYSARMQIRQELESTSFEIELTTSNGRITITPLTGQIDLYISDDDTAALDFESAVYDLEIESVGGETTRLTQGKVKLSKEATR